MEDHKPSFCRTTFFLHEQEEIARYKVTYSFLCIKSPFAHYIIVIKKLLCDPISI